MTIDSSLQAQTAFQEGGGAIIGLYLNRLLPQDEVNTFKKEEDGSFELTLKRSMTGEITYTHLEMDGSKVKPKPEKMKARVIFQKVVKGKISEGEITLDKGCVEMKGLVGVYVVKFQETDEKVTATGFLGKKVLCNWIGFEKSESVSVDVAMNMSQYFEVDWQKA